MDYVLRTNALTKTYKGKNVVDKVTMNIRKGDIYGLIGKNGAGKTTLMKMITGLAHPSDGTIELFGNDNYEKSLIRTGCTIENPGIYTNMTAIQNLEAYSKLLGITDKNVINSILKTVDLSNDLNKKTKNFSLGMKQRLAIGIALLGSPDFLILDEPINGLDPTGIKNIRELLIKLNREKEITIIISSHILGELSKIATSYGIINNGALVDEFTSAELETRCKRSLKIKVDNVKLASNILETVIGTTNYDVLDDSTIRLFDNIDNSGLITSELCKNNVIVDSVTPVGQDLEEYFMDLMEVKNNA